MRWLTAFIILVLAVPGQCKLLDPKSAPDALLDQLAPLLQEQGIDVARNLNSPSTKPKKRLRRPRLGMLADLPTGSLANSEELKLWEASFKATHIAGMVILPADNSNEDGNFTLEEWFDSASSDRTFLTYAKADQELASIIAGQLRRLNYEVRDFSYPQDTLGLQEAGRFYATAGQRLVLDSKQARGIKTAAAEFSLLGRQLYRRSNSVYPPTGKSARFYLAGEPKRFKKADLGDEVIAAVIPEIIVSGGVALGEQAIFKQALREIHFTDEQLFQLDMENGETWTLAPLDLPLVKTCFDFALRSVQIKSDAIIDIDERHKIRMSEAFRDTDIGYELITIDGQPFEFVTNLSAIKSVIIDTTVTVAATDSKVNFNTGYEIRFINPDRRKLAETRVALAYEYDSKADLATYRSSWGPRAFKIQKVDLAELGAQTRRVALVAGWVALFRTVNEQSIEFLRGRYEFMKIDKSGKTTPRTSFGL